MDGLVLIINRDFLKKLNDRGLKVLSLKIKYTSRDKTARKFKFKEFPTYDSYIAYHSNVLNSRNPLCSAGDFPIIENIELSNINLYFPNDYKWYNITEKRLLVESIKYDSFRNDFQISEVKRYKKLAYDIMEKYVSDLNKAIDIRLDSYVDPCYVDAGYVSPNSESNSLETINLIKSL